MIYRYHVLLFISFKDITSVSLRTYKKSPILLAWILRTCKLGIGIQIGSFFLIVLEMR